LVKSDWTRFDFYARRIRKLGDHPPLPTENILRTEEVHRDVFVAFLTYRPAKDFFPNLRTLQTTYHSHEVLQYFPAFLGPKIRNVIIDCDDWIDATSTYFPVSPLHIANLFASLSQLKPTLHVLKCHEDVSSPALESALFNLIQDSHDLRVLDLHDRELPRAAVTHLSRLPSLERLFIGDIDIPLYTTNDGRFPKLAEWSFSAPSLSSCTASLEAMALCPFTCLLIECNINVEPMSQVLELTKAISCHRSHSSLTAVHLTWISSTQNDCPNPDGTYLSLPDALYPLFSLPSLEEVYISSKRVRDLDDSWIAQAALAWPLLDSFALPSRPRPLVPRITLAGLVPLIKHCPNLCNIYMQIDAKPVPLALLEGVRNTRIQTIVIHGSAIDQPLGVLRSLIHLFPNLVYVDGQLARPSGPMSPIQERYNNCWENVNDLLRGG
jgi:hypothetical protein